MRARSYIILKTPDYIDWYNELPLKDRVQIQDRLLKIQKEGYFGVHKCVDAHEVIWELKWTGGRRIYYAYIPPQNILLLLGGNKNGQNQDINKAKKIYKKAISA